MSGRIRDAQGRFTADPFAAVRDAARKAEADALAVYRTACQPVPGSEWDNLFAQISDQVNQARIDMHRRVDQAYALILGEVPAREAPVAFIHQRGVVLELGGAEEERAASAWSTWDTAMADAARDTADAEVAHEPHPSGPLPAGDWAISLPPVSLDLDPAAEQHMRNFLTLTRQDGGFSEPDEEGTSWRVTPDVPGAEGPPDSAPGTPGRPAPDETEGAT